MADTQAVKHNKIKNPGILFELLTRQLTSDIISGVQNSSAKKIISKHFRKNSELGREYLLYQALTNEKFSNPSAANMFIDEVIASHKKLNKTELKKQKYNLIKEIKQSYDADAFFKNKIENYKILASIYKMFQAKSHDEEYSPAESVACRYTIIEHIIPKETVTDGISSESATLAEYRTQEKDLRLLAYKLMIEKFNEKYKVLDENQKSVLKQFLNNMSNAKTLKEFIISKIDPIEKELTTLNSAVDNQITSIKINEVVNQLRILKEVKNISENHMVAMMNIYELIKELKKMQLEKK